jgi:calcineurin-like phosphoesterase family protein
MPPGELREQDHEGLWLWSDLHLGHAMTISVFGRPYSTPEEMDDALYGVWRRLVDPADTVVILGDVAIGGLSSSQLTRFRAAPGRKMLVLGNHEFDGTVGGHREGFEQAYSTVYVPGRPELLLTHVPLRDIPDGCVNVHGHVHRWAPSETRHINVVVEQTRYRPRSLAAVRRLAALLVRDARVPGRTTAQQLTHALAPGGSLL